MAKFKFTLETVQRHRKILENIAQKDFQQAQSEVVLLRQELFEMHESIHVARQNAFEQQVAGGTASSSLNQINDFIKLQDIRIARQMEKIANAEKKVEELREILRVKAIDHKIIDEYREKKKAEFVEEVKKKEQKTFDDLSLMRQRMKEKR
jgi:flagellar protein FliJ